MFIHVEHLYDACDSCLVVGHYVGGRFVDVEQFHNELANSQEILHSQPLYSHALTLSLSSG